METKTYVVFYGDWCGEVYASVPLEMFRDDITPQDLKDVCVRIEQLAWSCNISKDDPDGGAMIAYREMTPGAGIMGGMGGGICAKDGGPWINDRLPNLCREFIEEHYA